MKRFNSFILFIVVILAVLQSCAFAKVVRTVRNEKVKIEPIAFKNKKIVFIPISHVGQVKFYNDLKDTVQSLKNSRYNIFYEGISHKKADYDSITSDILIRKNRKISGGNIFNLKHYKDLEKVPMYKLIFKDFKVQPNFEELGISETDVNADLNLEQFVRLNENKFGIIELDSIDINTPIDLPYSGKKNLGKYDWSLLDERNQNVANMVKKSSCEKIAIIYGSKHYKGIKKYIRSN